MVEMADVAGAEYAFAHHEHLELMAGLAGIRSAADVVSRAPAAEALARIRYVRSWIASAVGPHTAWEDSVIFPEIDALCGSRWPTKLMRFDHLQISRATAELDRDVDILVDSVPTHDQRLEMQAHLLALEVMLRSHFEREEAILLPLLDASR